MNAVLCLDVGNTQIYGGVFENKILKLRFRHATAHHLSADEWGVFLRSVLRENNVDASSVQRIAICSVVPTLNYSLQGACDKYFHINPLILSSDHGKFALRYDCSDPFSIGSDLIAAALGARNHFPDQHMVIADFGTATTLSAIHRDGIFLGVSIAPGLKTSMEALSGKTAQLHPVSLEKPSFMIGTCTTQSIQSGLFWSQWGLVECALPRIQKTLFQNQPVQLIGTGGFSHLFRDIPNILILPDLTLEGLWCVLNREYGLS